MSNNIKRIFVEKRPEFAVEAQELLADLKQNLGLANINGLRILNRYDVLGLTDKEFEDASHQVFSEPPVDMLFEEELVLENGSKAFVVELLPGQYDQREDFAEQCVQLITQKDKPTVS
ncbi:MAG: phosphoribosylformylglycinamidine synthase, partial [Acidaminococcaceae bacterium]